MIETKAIADNANSGGSEAVDAEGKKKKKKKKRCWEDYEPTPGKKPYSDRSCQTKEKKSMNSIPIQEAVAAVEDFVTKGDDSMSPETAKRLIATASLVEMELVQKGHGKRKFDESKVKRDGGKFSSTGGSGAKKKKPRGSGRKKTRGIDPSKGVDIGEASRFDLENKRGLREKERLRREREKKKVDEFNKTSRRDQEANAKKTDFETIHQFVDPKKDEYFNSKTGEAVSTKDAYNLDGSMKPGIMVRAKKKQAQRGARKESASMKKKRKLREKKKS